MHTTVYKESGGDSAGGGRKERKVHSAKELNLTSMLDVCFLLLIFFILTASFTVGEGILPALLPGTQPSEDPLDLPKPPVNVMITSLGGDGVRLMVDGLNREITSFREFYVHLRRLQRTHMADGHTPVVIRPGGEVAWQHVVNAFNQASRASYENISFSNPR